MCARRGKQRYITSTTTKKIRLEQKSNVYTIVRASRNGPYPNPLAPVEADDLSPAPLYTPSVPYLPTYLAHSIDGKNRLLSLILRLPSASLYGLDIALNRIKRRNTYTAWFLPLLALGVLLFRCGGGESRSLLSSVVVLMFRQRRRREREASRADIDGHGA